MILLMCLSDDSRHLPLGPESAARGDGLVPPYRQGQLRGCSAARRINNPLVKHSALSMASIHVFAHCPLYLASVIPASLTSDRY